MKLLFLFFIILLFEGVANADDCNDWFKNLNIDPQDQNCEMKCAMGDVDMGNFNCPIGCSRHCKAKKMPKDKKKSSDQCDENLAKKLDCCRFKNEVESSKGTKNQCDLFASTVSDIVLQAETDKKGRGWIMDQLKEVFVGDGVSRNQRSKGHCFGGRLNGATGFKTELKDTGNQVQHAVAGIWASYHFGSIGCWIMNARESAGSDPQDLKLNEITCRLGKILNNGTLMIFQKI